MCGENSHVIVPGDYKTEEVKHSHKNAYQLTKDDNKRYDSETSIKMEVCRGEVDVTWYGALRIMVTFKLDCIAHPGFSRWCQVFAFQAVSYFVGGIFISSKGVLSELFGIGRDIFILICCKFYYLFYVHDICEMVWVIE